ncbi:VanZ family protein [Halobaculum sp. EA56]|uniref:VanZ family protein n=1 Tax=Halobaculum sp. EA56 TaxID=3421648 RepID=UPI003EC11DA9
MSRLAVPLLPRRVRYAGVAAALAVIVYYSLLSAPPSSPGDTPFWDKHLHFVAYAGLALALAYATVRYRDRPGLRTALVFGGALAVGVAIELLQGTLPNRYFGRGDLLANALGSALVGVWFVVERRVRYVRARRLLDAAT